MWCIHCGAKLRQTARFCHRCGDPQTLVIRTGPLRPGDAFQGGRYQIIPQSGATALRRDERARMINGRSGRNAFVGMFLAIMVISLYTGVFGLTQLPTWIVHALIGFGIFIYFASDFWHRRHA